MQVFFQQLEEGWSAGEVAALETAGVTIDRIKTAYSQLFAGTSITLDPAGSMNHQLSVVGQLLQAGHAARGRTFDLLSVCECKKWPRARRPLEAKVAPDVYERTRKSFVQSDATVVVYTTGAGSETTILGRLLQAMLQESVQVSVGLQLAVAEWTAAPLVLIPLITRDILDSPAFSTSVARCFSHGTPELVSVSGCPDFPFPSPAFLNAVAGGSLGDCPPDLTPELLADAYRSVFRILALPLSPLASKAKIALEVGEVARRIRVTAVPKSSRLALSRVESKASREDTKRSGVVCDGIASVEGGSAE
mmetsp:Transcript_20519/g.52092  ORF Transcript_20519/g.52092 Transcript_20519/m.52092 type:complete len:306 (-) Transcript_20519:111-1028(-)